MKGKLVGGRAKFQTEEKLAKLLYEEGPFAIALAADGPYKNEFLDLNEGVLDLPNTSHYNPDHAFVLVTDTSRIRQRASTVPL